MRTNIFRVIPAAFLVAVGVAGCTSVVTGTATRAPGSTTPDGVELDLLETGPYPTAPLAAFGLAETPVTGALEESARLANFVVLPTDLDPALLRPFVVTGVPLKNPESLSLVMSSADDDQNGMVAAAAAHNFVTGFASQRRTGEDVAEQRGLINAVLVFPDDASAAAAAKEMAAADAVAWPQFPTRPQAIPRYPDAVANVNDVDGHTVTSYLPYQRYVLYQSSYAPTPEAAADLVATTLDAQRPLLDQFTPTDPTKLVALPRDPSGLLARTLPTADYEATKSGRVREPAAALHYQSNPILSGRLFDEVGMVAVATNDTTVYETSQDDGGSRLVDAFATEAVSDMGLVAAPGIDAMPGARCFGRPQSENSVTLFTCYGAAGKYGFEATATQLEDAHQKSSAQYLMLTAP